MLVAGEPSGDLLGARLMQALVARTGGRVRFSGIGGEAMAAAGLDSLFPMTELSIMGLAEILPRVPRLLRRLSQTRDAALAARPDVLVTIDSPGFAFRLAKRLRGRGIPLVHYVAPSVWAWRPGRAKTVAGFLDHLLTLLPFEPPYFERHGLACSFVGHPAIEGGMAEADGSRFRDHHGIAEAPMLAVLPGSRAMEVERHLPIFEATVGRLRQRWPDLVVALPTAPTVADAVASEIGRWPSRNLVLEGEGEKFDAFAAADAALAVSGTVTLELALAGTPTVVAYRTSPLTAAIVGKLILVEHVSLANILLEREVQPELIQARCRPDLLTAARSRDETPDRTTETLRAMLTSDAASPSLAAADAVLAVIEASANSSTPPGGGSGRRPGE